VCKISKNSFHKYVYSTGVHFPILTFSSIVNIVIACQHLCFHSSICLSVCPSICLYARNKAAFVLSIFTETYWPNWTKWLLFACSFLPNEQTLKVAQLVKTFPAFYRTRRFISLFTRAHYRYWARWIPSIPPSPVPCAIFRDMLLFLRRGANAGAGIFLFVTTSWTTPASPSLYLMGYEGSFPVRAN
jgi:hypothetical protein